MEVLSVIRGTAIHFQAMESPVDLFITDVVDELRRRYRFLEVPSRADEIGADKVLRFGLGRFEAATIEKLEVYDTGLVARGAVETEVLDRFLEDVSGWASGTQHVKIDPSQPVARGYLSTLEVTPTLDLSKWTKGLDAFREMLSTMVAAQGFSIEPYEMVSMAMQSDKEKAHPLHPGRFVLERRAGRPFDDNVFFSEAPVATSDHKKLLDLLETLL
jgi:hypothetical protein